MLHHVREFKKVLECGFNAVDSGFQALDSSLCQWNLDSGFPELYSGFQNPGFRIPQAKVPWILIRPITEMAAVKKFFKFYLFPLSLDQVYFVLVLINHKAQNRYPEIIMARTVYCY